MLLATFTFHSDVANPEYVCKTYAIYIHRHSPHNIVAQANKIRTGNNMPNDKKQKNYDSSTHINYVTLNSQY